jgi:Cupin domain
MEKVRSLWKAMVKLSPLGNMTSLVVCLSAAAVFGVTAYFFSATAYAAITNVLAVGSLADSDTYGPSTITVRTISFAPGEVGVWHYHPGPLFNVVTQGTVTLEDGFCGEDRSFGPGQAFEEGSRIHRPRNNGGEATFAYQTFVIPQGSPTTVNLPNFVPRCHREE